MINENANQNRSEALGLLWADACGVEVDYDQAYAIGRRLDNGVCSQIINQESVSKLEDEYATIKLDDLRSECGGATAGTDAAQGGRK